MRGIVASLSESSPSACIASISAFTPPDVMAKLEAACAAAAKEPAFAASMKDQGTVVNYLNAKDYAEFLKNNDVLNRDLAKDLGMLKR